MRPQLLDRSRATLRPLLCRAALVLAVAAAAGADVYHAAAPQDADGRLWLGVLRSDGILQPFAMFDGDDWSSPWPTTIAADVTGRRVELPISLTSIPEKWWGGRGRPGEWRLWSTDHQEGLPVTPLAPIVVPVGYTRGLGLRTDFAGPRPPASPFELPFPKAGLAIAGDVEPLPILPVNPNVPSVQALLKRLRPEIDRAEERAIQRIRANAGWRHPFDRDERAEVAAVVEALYTTALGPGVFASYIELVKKYPLLPEDKGCGLESFVTGWLHQDLREDRLKAELKVNVSYCDREHASYMLPLGALRLRDRLHWVFQMSGQRDEWYAVAELTPGRVKHVVEYYAGGLPDVAPARRR